MTTDKEVVLRKMNNKDGSYIVALRFLEQAKRELERIDTALSNQVKEKLKEPLRELEDIIW